MANVKNYLASCNTGIGFVNYFEYINEKNKNGFQYILKGGPGTGKNTIMKKIGQFFEKQNYSIEYFYCSSDNTSLDGVRIKEKNISVVDGTAPHITEAKYIGVTHQIVNLGDFINPEIKKFEKELIEYGKKKKIYFDLAYKYLESANKIFEANILLQKNKINKNKLKKIENQIKNNIQLGKNKKFENRKLFLEAQNYSLENKNNYNNIIEIELSNYEANILFNNLIKCFNKKNYSIISIQNKIDPQYIDAMFVEELNQYIKINNKNNIKNNNLIKILINKTEEYITKAKEEHMLIENIYKKYIDINQLNILANNLIQTIQNTL